MNKLALGAMNFFFMDIYCLNMDIQGSCSDEVTSRNMNKSKELGVWIMYREDYFRWREQEGQRAEGRSTGYV